MQGLIGDVEGSRPWRLKEIGRVLDIPCLHNEGIFIEQCALSREKKVISASSAALPSLAARFALRRHQDEQKEHHQAALLLPEDLAFG